MCTIVCLCMYVYEERKRERESTGHQRMREHGKNWIVAANVCYGKLAGNNLDE